MSTRLCPKTEVLSVFSCGSGNDKGYHEADFLYDFLVFLFLVGQQPLQQMHTHTHPIGWLLFCHHLLITDDNQQKSMKYLV